MPDAPQLSQPAYDILPQIDVMVPARDEIGLATDLYFPAKNGVRAEGRFPVVMERTPYGKHDPGRVKLGRYYAQRGYVCVFQDNRGRYRSEGRFTKYVDDGPDGYDTVQWLIKQPWCSGKVGTFGTSYGAHTQGAMASLNPPGLAFCFFDSGAFSSAFHSACRNGGAFEMRQALWAFREAENSVEAARDPVVKAALQAEDIGAWMQRLPWRKGHSPLRWAPDYEDYLLELWGHEVFDAYWKQVGICAEAHYKTWSDIPQVHFGAWYDTYTLSTTDNFMALSKTKKEPVLLVMGPWTHGGRSASYSGDVEFGPQATVGGINGLDYDAFRLWFFDRFLKGEKNGLEETPRVRYFLMGGGTGRKNRDGRLDAGGEWLSARSWPPEGTVFTPFFFHGDGVLSPTAPARSAPPSRYQFDPSHPVPTIGGNISSGQPLMEGGAFHQQEGPRFYGSRPPYLPLAARQDVLVFETAPLEEDVVVAGPVEVSLWASSSAPDTDFTAKLLDVYPPNADYPQGFDMNLCDGIIRAKFRDSWEKPKLMEAGNPYKLTVRLYPTAVRFKKGHRIRVDISSSNFPRFDVNPNTGEPAVSGRTFRVADQTVYHDATRPSHILLPVMKAA